MTFARLICAPARLAAIALAGAALAACAGGGAYDYDRYAVGVPAEVYGGRLIGVEPVRIGGTRSGVGAVSGAAIGGALGSEIGGGRAENVAAGVGLAVVGGLIGAAIEEDATSQDAFRYTVELDDGRTISVVQPDHRPVAAVGSRVRVEYGRAVRVLPG
ncbi:MAG: hypothetical protein ACE5FO_01330 [Parvularculaceae bacterium]